MATRALTISELEELAGVTRAVVYFYVHRGLLPAPQKASTTRGVYSDVHLELLAEIEALKSEGLTLEMIRERLASRIASAEANGEDLVARQEAERRAAILEEAARQFARKGYGRTRIADIVAALGITTQQLYALFPTKHHLFVACYRVYVRWMGEELEPRAEAEDDPAARLAWRMQGSAAIRALSPDLQALAQAESTHQDDDLSELIRSTYEAITASSELDLSRLRANAPRDVPLSDELLAFGLFGSLEMMLMRVSWDDEYQAIDAMRTLEAMFLAVKAVYEGRIDISESVERLGPLLATASRVSRDLGSRLSGQAGGEEEGARLATEGRAAT
jgi:AcrR family transcriptional regulator